MRLTAKTRMLLAVTAVLVLLNLLVGASRSVVSEVPRIQAVTRDSVTRIELSGAEDKLVIRPEGGRWRVTAPYQAEADQQAVQALIGAFRKEIAVDALVDRGNEDKYGLEPGKGTVVEVWTDGDEPDISFTVGDDTAGGSSYIRLSGDDAVYRARVGGEARFSRPASGWRSRFVLELEPERVVGLVFKVGESELSLSRPALDPAAEGAARVRPWSLEPAPPWPVDQALADVLGARLAQLRAVAILPADTATGAQSGEVQLSLDDGSTHTLRLFARPDGPLLATVDEVPERFRVPDLLLSFLPDSADDLRDRTILRLVREDIDTLLLEDAAGQVLLRQDATTGVWQPIQPANLALDVKQTQQAATALTLLRAESVVDDPAAVQTGLSSPSLRLTVTRVDGSTERVEVGAARLDEGGKRHWYAARVGSTVVYQISDDLLQVLKAGFGRG